MEGKALVKEKITSFFAPLHRRRAIFHPASPTYSSVCMHPRQALLVFLTSRGEREGGAANHARWAQRTVTTPPLSTPNFPPGVARTENRRDRAGNGLLP